MKRRRAGSMRLPAYNSSISLVIPLDGNSPFYPEYIMVFMEFLREFTGMLELIVIDNGIDERTFRTITIYSRLLERAYSNVRIRILRSTGRFGVAESINYGIRMALGEKVVVILLGRRKNGYKKMFMECLEEFFWIGNIYFVSKFPSIYYLRKITVS